jgi:cytochrome c556
VNVVVGSKVTGFRRVFWQQGENKMKRFVVVSLFSAAVVAIALAANPHARADAKTACGEEGQPACPLQGWMEDHVQAALEKKDLKAVGEALEKVPALVPDAKWNEGDNGWSKLAKAGADAAKAGDMAGVKASCKSCHKAWRENYRKQFRLRALPK